MTYRSREHKDVEAFAIGVLVVVVLGWCFRNWRLVFGLLAALYVYDQISLFFSPQSTDLSSEIGTAYKKIDVVAIHATQVEQGAFLSGPNVEDYYKDKSLYHLDVTFKNRSGARVTGLTVYCSGQTVTQPPDRSYAPEVENTWNRFRVYPIMFEERITQTITIAPDGTNKFKSDLNKISCRVEHADYVESDFYRNAGERDRYNVSWLTDTIHIHASDKPTTYMGSKYPIIIQGYVSNSAKQTIKKFRVDCAYVRDDSFATYKSVMIETPIAPDGRIHIDTQVETDYMQPTGQECHIGQVWF